MEPIHAGRYRVLEEIGAGSFGTVYRGTDVRSGQEVAVKAESPARSQCFSALHLLEDEYQVYRALGTLPGIPRCLHFGQGRTLEGERCKVLVLELLGDSLHELLKQCSGKFSQKTVLYVAEQALSLIEAVHSKGFLHRDIKPGNFLFGARGSASEHQLFIIDFGLSCKYRSGGAHVPQERSGSSMVGTALYASLNAMRGITLSRRDDLESLAYMLVFLLRGQLPWQNLPAGTRKQKLARILEIKSSTSVAELCKDLPLALRNLLTYSRELNFAQQPDYGMLRGLFQAEFRRQRFQRDGRLDWHFSLGPTVQQQQQRAARLASLRPRRLGRADLSGSPKG